MAKTKKKTFLEMSPAERAAEVAKLDRGTDFAQLRPLSAKGKLLWERARRGRGRPPKREDEKAVKVLVTLAPALLEKADSFAGTLGMTRSGVIAKALNILLAETSDVAIGTRSRAAPARGKRES